MSNNPAWVDVCIEAFKEMLDNTIPEKVNRSKELIAIIMNEFGEEVGKIEKELPI